MSINFSNNVGNLFNRVGKLALLVKQLASYQATQYTSMADPTVGVAGQFFSEPDIGAIIGSSYLGNLQAPETIAQTAQQMTVAAFNRAVFRDNPQLNQTLTQANIVTSVFEVIRQMKLQGATVLRQTVGATTAPFIGTGNGVILASLIRPFDGNPLENAFAETLTFLVNSDSYSGNATAGNEGLAVSGQGSERDLFAFDWPLGSNASGSQSAINGDASNSQGNLLTNSGFLTWLSGPSTNVPANFTIVQGTPGTNVFQETTLTYTGGNALKVVCDGSQKILTQAFGSSGGTLGTLSPQTQYGFNVFLRSGATVPNAGSLVVTLTDGSGNTLTDASGNSLNSNSFALTGLNTVYASYRGAFRTPVIMPSSALLQLTFPASANNSAAVYADRMAMGPMRQLYTGGPFFAVFSGSIPFVVGDYGMATVTNGRGAGGTLSTMQTALWRLLNPASSSNEILFPSSATPSLSDALIG